MIPSAGTTLADGRYRLERRLGIGGMATVWLGIDERLGRPVAVKIVADRLVDDEQWARRFEREARAAAAVSHPGVVPILDYGVDGGRPFLVMQYIAGGSLADRLRDPTAPRPDPEGVARELLDALAAVHAAGIVHRDVKAANLLLDERNHLRLTDFGIAQPEDATALTQTGMVVGTLRYLAPEILAGEPATVRSDLYSAGLVIGDVARDRETPRLRGLIEALTAEAAADRPASAAAARALLDVPLDVERTGGAPTALTRRMLLRPNRADEPTGTPTRVVPAPGRGPVASGESPAHAPRLSAAAVVGALAAAAVLVAFVVILATSVAGTSRAPALPPGPAPAGSSLNRQLDGLQRIVDYARTH